MADFNSRYTGAEIEAAIAKTEKIGEFAVVWNGSPTTSPIMMNSLPVNPATGDRTGLYFVHYETQGATNYTSVSTMHVHDMSKGTVGSGHTDFALGGDSKIYMSTTHVEFDHTAGEIKALADMYVATDNNLMWENHAVEISKIYRYQEAQ